MSWLLEQIEVVKDDNLGWILMLTDTQGNEIQKRIFDPVLLVTEVAHWTTKLALGRDML